MKSKDQDFARVGLNTEGYSVPKGNIRAEGKIRNFNTVEEFKNVDMPAILQLAAKQVF